MSKLGDMPWKILKIYLCKNESEGYFKHNFMKLVVQICNYCLLNYKSLHSAVYLYPTVNNSNTANTQCVYG